MDRTPLIWSNDDLGAGRADRFKNILSFLNRWGIKGSFFVIPVLEGRPLTADKELCELMLVARDEGHCFYQHGYEHHAYENGVPELWMLDYNAEVKELYDRERFAMERLATRKELTRRIRAGMDIWQEVFGEMSPGYRAGWGSYSRNMYMALAELGFKWDSSRLSSRTSWLWGIEGPESSPVELSSYVPVNPYRIGELWEYPIIGDFAYRVKPGEEDAYLKLGKELFHLASRKQAPFLLVTHWHGLEHTENAGYRVMERFLDDLMNEDEVEPITMDQLHDRVTKGKLTSAPPVEVI